MIQSKATVEQAQTLVKTEVTILDSLTKIKMSQRKVSTIPRETWKDCNKNKAMKV
jgi:hypothetical protein